MKLERLTLAYFRGFEQIEIGFEMDITVVAGVNGVGKSSVLRALTVAMSQGLPAVSACKEAPLGVSDTDVQFGKPALALSMALALPGAKVRVDLNRAVPLDPAKAAALIKQRDGLRFAIRETKKRSKAERALINDLRLIEHQLTPSDQPLVRVLPTDVAIEPEDFTNAARGAANQPFAVYYSTTRLLSKLPSSPPPVRTHSVETAFEKALSPQLEVSLNDFANWVRVVAIQPERAQARSMFRQLSRAIKNFLPGVSRLRLELPERRQPQFSVRKQGSLLFLEQLSDGERGLLALVFDLTRRLAIANPQFENPIRDGIALVLVDEIELHLHPRWQRDVVRRLRETFPACQFVLSTHSPQVLGEVEARCVRLLSFEDGKVLCETPAMALGADSNWILNVLMEADEMNEEVERELEEISSLVAARELDQAKPKLHALRDRLGNTEAIQQQASIIERIERLGR